MLGFFLGGNFWEFKSLVTFCWQILVNTFLLVTGCAAWGITHVIVFIWWSVVEIRHKTLMCFQTRSQTNGKFSKLEGNIRGDEEIMKKVRKLMFHVTAERPPADEFQTTLARWRTHQLNQSYIIACRSVRDLIFTGSKLECSYRKAKSFSTLPCTTVHACDNWDW